MKSLDELIAHYEEREREMGLQRDRINAQALTRHYTAADQKRFAASFEDERQVARDTVSWLKTIRARK